MPSISDKNRIYLFVVAVALNTALTIGDFFDAIIKHQFDPGSFMYAALMWVFLYYLQRRFQSGNFTSILEEMIDIDDSQF